MAGLGRESWHRQILRQELGEGMLIHTNLTIYVWIGNVDRNKSYVLGLGRETNLT